MSPVFNLVRPPALVATAVIISLSFACTTGDTPDVDAGTEPDVVDAGGAEPEATCPAAESGASDGLCAQADRVGGFVVDNQIQFTVVSGLVSSGVIPQSVSIEREADAGCALLERPLLFCDPPCAAGETCDGNQCIPFPEAQDKGQVTISGLDTCINMEPFPPGFNYFFNGLGRPGMEPGALVELQAEDMNLFATGVDEMSSEGDDWILVDGAPLALTWVPPQTAGAEVSITVSIDQHGTSPLKLECTFPDTGNAEVPAALISALINAGVSGFPSGSIVRRTADRMDIAEGCVDFSVQSSRPKRVRVEGFTPCDTDEECPAGQTCDVPNQICQ